MSKIALGVGAGALLLIVLGLDWLLGGVTMNAVIYDGMAPEAILTAAYGPVDGIRASCIPVPGRRYDDNIAEYFSCAHGKVADGVEMPVQGAVASMCEPVHSEVYVHRDLPFTNPTLDALLYASGSGTGQEMADRLRTAHSMTYTERLSAYPQVRGMHSGFFDDPSPDIAFLDCPGYSILKLRIQR
ncbi:hypothetical protein ASC89_01510 [Devosia sp. Root413D1]|uniref:hypothetical protein n=1 Tax=unclassified Devosia TaxID=196773 RepID=UPI0006FED9B4|nr:MULTISPECIES: hypothetical protein [unclassified Devosia]KQV09387.1 hypothetical protein ASC68_03560 [Devosia sp. Root105]KQW85779.1 hypothetical protein ASC89_01510 [Devosia sp. Root413D1]